MAAIHTPCACVAAFAGFLSSKSAETSSLNMSLLRTLHYPARDGQSSNPPLETGNLSKRRRSTRNRVRARTTAARVYLRPAHVEGVRGMANGGTIACGREPVDAHIGSLTRSPVLYLCSCRYRPSSPWLSRLTRARQERLITALSPQQVADVVEAMKGSSQNGIYSRWGALGSHLFTLSEVWSIPSVPNFLGTAKNQWQCVLSINLGAELVCVYFRLPPHPSTWGFQTTPISRSSRSCTSRARGCTFILLPEDLRLGGTSHHSDPIPSR